MSNIVQFTGAATTPADVLATVSDDAGRMRAVVVVALLDDGSWHVRHSTTQASIVHSACVHLQKFAMEI